MLKFKHLLIQNSKNSQKFRNNQKVKKEINLQISFFNMNKDNSKLKVNFQVNKIQNHKDKLIKKILIFKKLLMKQKKEIERN